MDDKKNNADISLEKKTPITEEDVVKKQSLDISKSIKDKTMFDKLKQIFGKTSSETNIFEKSPETGEKAHLNEKVSKLLKFPNLFAKSPLETSPETGEKAQLAEKAPKLFKFENPFAKSPPPTLSIQDILKAQHTINESKDKESLSIDKESLSINKESLSINKESLSIQDIVNKKLTAKNEVLEPNTAVEWKKVTVDSNQIVRMAECDKPAKQSPVDGILKKIKDLVGNVGKKPASSENKKKTPKVPDGVKGFNVPAGVTGSIKNLPQTLIQFVKSPPKGPRDPGARPMKYPYTFTAKMVQFPWMYYIRHNWIYRYYVVGVLASIPIFRKLSNMSHSEASKEKWAEYKRKEKEEFEAHAAHH